MADLKSRLKKAFLDPYKKLVQNFNREMNKGSLNELTDEVKAQIRKGISPVDQVGRFVRYSETYIDAIKKGTGEAEKKGGQRSPVNMTLTGEMLKSLEIVRRGDAILMQFDDPKAYFHNNSGAGKSRVIRRLLPDNNGERFNAVLQRKFVAAMKRIMKRARPR